tara:strand:- start:14638 stop:15141 length:504 start_codon:yes stop_codon:yes gene_type:complete
MDLNTMFAASSVGRQDDYDTQIIKEVWANFPTDEDMSNFTKADFEGETSICEKAYESQGSVAYNKCYEAAISANTPEHNALVTKYAEAQAGGYSKDFSAFKTKTNVLGLAKGLLDSLFAPADKKHSNSFRTGETYPKEEESKTGLYIGIGAVVLVGIGTAIYFGTRR